MAVYNDFGVPQLPPNFLPEQEVEGETKRLLRKALSANGTLTNTVQPGQGSMLPNALGTMRDRAAGMYDRATQLMSQPLDYSGIQTFAKQRGQEGEQAMLNALAAQYAGEQFQPLQQQLMKTAAGAREPIKMGGGMITGAGQFIKDPEAAQDKEVALLLNQAKAYEQMAQTAETARERIEAQRKHDQTMEQLRVMGLGLQQQGLDLRRQIAQNSNSAVGSFAQAGFTPQGQQVVTNTKSGVNYLLNVQPDGTPSYTPYQGPTIPKATFEKEASAAGDLSAVAARADQLVKQIEDNPSAFGLRSAAIGAVPGPFQGYAAKAVGLTPQQLEARSTVLRQAAQEINELYGAALSMGEQARANTFLPNPADPPEMLISKLKAARDWAKTQMGRYSPGVVNAAGARSGGPQPAPGGNLSDKERAELAELRAKYPRPAGGQ